MSELQSDLDDSQTSEDSVQKNQNLNENKTLAEISNFVCTLNKENKQNVKYKKIFNNFVKKSKKRTQSAPDSRLDLPTRQTLLNNTKTDSSQLYYQRFVLQLMSHSLKNRIVVDSRKMYKALMVSNLQAKADSKHDQLKQCNFISLIKG